MACFNFFSHGTQDLYPTFLKLQHQFDAHTVSLIAMGYNIAAMLGGITFGRLSERIGRKKAIMLRVAAGIAGAAAVGLLPWRGGAGGRRLPDAVYGPGRLGCGSDLPHRAGAGQCEPVRCCRGSFTSWGI